MFIFLEADFDFFSLNSFQRKKKLRNNKNSCQLILLSKRICINSFKHLRAAVQNLTMDIFF